MEEVIMSLAGIAAGVWVIVGVLSVGEKPLLPSRWRPVVGLILGLVGSIIVHMAGFVTFDQAEPPWSWLAMGLFGLIATATASFAHDKLGFKNTEKR